MEVLRFRKFIIPYGNIEVILSSLALLSRQDRIRTCFVLIIQVLLATLDLVGVGIIGALGALTLTSATSKGPGNRLAFLLDKLGIDDASLQLQAVALGLLAALILILKTLLSMMLLKRTNLYLGRRGARLSADMIEKVFKLPYLRLREQSLMSWQFQLTTAIDLISTGIITTFLLMVSDTFLLIVMSIGLFYVEPSIAFCSLVLFSGGAFWVYKRQHNKSLEIGTELAKTSIRTNDTLQLMFESYKDLYIRAAFPTYSKTMRKLRLQSSDLNAIRSYMPYVGKYTLEIILVLGFLLISASQFFLNDSSRAVANIAVFFVASARISPAVLRIQQGLLMIKGNRGQARNAFELIRELSTIETVESSRKPFEIRDREINGLGIEVQNVSFHYPKNPTFKLENISLRIQPRETVAIVGASGSGKSTLIDLLLGLLTPNEGLIQINSHEPSFILRNIPGSFAFVPQRIVVANGTVRENLALGLEEVEIADEFFWDALQKAQLEEFFRAQPDGLETLLGVGGIDLSGGQTQRLGLARALLTRPSLLILDEATSSLDGKTEFLITDALSRIEGTLTLVVVAHRLSTIKNFEKVIYLRNGRVEGSGSFQELIIKIPDLAQQAELMRI